MIRPNTKELDVIKSNTEIKGLKLILTCKGCGRRWAVWFSGEEDLLWNLPENWHVCLKCQKGENHE